MTPHDGVQDLAINDPALTFCTDVLHLDSLHWGLWQPEDTVTVENMRAAQHRFTEHLAAFIPDDVNKILDVGCGIGDNARHLHQKGYTMFCLSPDVNHEAAFKIMALPNVKFSRCRFEDYATDDRYDMILMSESNAYFKIDDCFRQCDTLLRDGGYILTASLFRRNHETGGIYPYHVEHDWMSAAAEHGYKILKSDDITERVLPTLTFFHTILCNYGEPMLRVLIRMIQVAPGKRMSIVRWILKNRIKSAMVNSPLRKTIEINDPERFRTEGRYTIHLLQKSAGLKNTL